jgi:hypothetical protein
MPLLKVNLGLVALLLLRAALPGLVGLLVGALIGLLPRIVFWRFFAHSVVLRHRESILGPNGSCALLTTFERSSPGCGDWTIPLGNKPRAADGAAFLEAPLGTVSSQIN